MILGVCMGSDENSVRLAKEIGYRYIEVGLRGFYGDGAKNLDPFCSVLDKYKLRCEAANCPFPGVYDPSGRQSGEALGKVRDAMYDLVKKTSKIGIERLIIGAGGARVLPSPELRQNVLDQMADICRFGISPVLSEFGIIAVLEGLNKGETNMLLTTGDSVELARLVNMPNLKVMADLYHVNLEDEDYADFPKYTGYIHHAHIANPRPRVMPKRDDGFPYEPFFAALRSAGFDGRMSVEAGPNGDYVECLKEAYATLAPLC